MPHSLARPLVHAHTRVAVSLSPRGLATSQFLIGYSWPSPALRSSFMNYWSKFTV